MDIRAILLPLFVQVGLVYALAFLLGYARFGAFKRGEADVQSVTLTTEAWPDKAKQVGYAFNNQFQMPVLFYVLVILAIMFHKADHLFILTEWVFVIARILQAGIHVTSNVIAFRGGFYVIGALVLLFMWIRFALDILSSPSFGTL